ncbi:MAG: aconitase family protein [Nannocystaceae bacterium]
MPKTVRIWVEGDARGVVSPKDLILHLIGDPYFREEQWRESPTDTCVIQLGGPGLDQWNVDELSVLTNMTVEGGLMTGIVEPCEPSGPSSASAGGSRSTTCWSTPTRGPSTCGRSRSTSPTSR